MTEAEKQRQLEKLAYLWESGEWKLFLTHHAQARVILSISADGPGRLRDLVALRAILPEFAGAPVSKLLAAIGSAVEFDAGEFGNMEARRLEAAARGRGLRVQRVDTSFDSAIPVSKGGPLIIEDDELAQFAVDEMKRRGVGVAQVETD